MTSIQQTALSLLSFWNQRCDLLGPKRNRMALVLLCAVISSLFILVYNPLNIENFYINTRIGALVSVKWAGLIGSATLIISQFLLRPLFRLDHQSTGTFILWSFFELVFISVVIFLFFGERGRPLMDEFLLTTKQTIMLAIVPYSIACLLILLWQLSNKENQIRSEQPNSSTLLMISDENDRNSFFINPNDILYLKADDNYVQVYSIHDEIIEKRLVRNRLKAIEEQVESSFLLRIHRSYMINPTKIRSIEQAGSKIAIYLLHLPNKTFTVSPSYRSAVIDYMKMTK